MDMHSAKLDTLKQIIDMMTGHMLGGAAKRKKPDSAMEVTIEAEPEGDEAAEKDEKPAEDDMDDDTARQLADLYSKEDDEDEPSDTQGRGR